MLGPTSTLGQNKLKIYLIFNEVKIYIYSTNRHTCLHTDIKAGIRRGLGNLEYGPRHSPDRARPAAAAAARALSRAFGPKSGECAPRRFFSSGSSP